VGGQTHGLGLSYWVPLHGSGTYNSTPTRKDCSTYRARSTMGPAWNLARSPTRPHRWTLSIPGTGIAGWPATTCGPGPHSPAITTP
jgi:hypothetical protein